MDDKSQKPRFLNKYIFREGKRVAYFVFLQIPNTEKFNVSFFLSYVNFTFNVTK